MKEQLNLDSSRSPVIRNDILHTGFTFQVSVTTLPVPCVRPHDFVSHTVLVAQSLVAFSSSYSHSCGKSVCHIPVLYFIGDE